MTAAVVLLVAVPLGILASLWVWRVSVLLRQWERDERAEAEE